MRSLSLVLAFGFGLGLGACGADDGDTPPPPDDGQVTWFQDVAPILSRHCMTCHQDGGIAPFSLTEYDSAKDNSELILALSLIHISEPTRLLSISYAVF